MKIFILALYVAAVNCVSLPVDGVHQVVHSDHDDFIPPDVNGVHGQAPVGTVQGEVVHDQGNYVHGHGHGHQQNVHHGHPAHEHKPVGGKPVHRPVVQVQRPVADGQHHVPVHQQNVSSGRYYHRPGFSTYNQVPITQGQVPIQHGQVPIEHGQVVPIGIIQQDMEVNPDGSFHNVWESENGIKVQEEGTVRVIDRKTSAQTVNGEISYTDYDGNQFHLKYVADEFGFHPVGDHLPTPPPIPLGIARGLEWIAAHPQESKDATETHIHVEHN